MIESTYSVSSFEGFVSSNRRLHLPPNSFASPKFSWMDFAWPMCRYPFGSGGKRVCTRPLNLLVFKSSRMMSRMKLEGAVSVAVVSPVSAPLGRGFMVSLQCFNCFFDAFQARLAPQNFQRFK